MDDDATMRPLAGTPRAIERAVAGWLVDQEAPPLTVRTSGSSGEPKDVALSAAALTASATATHARLGGPGQWVLALPAHYVAGLAVIVRSILAGTTPVLLADHPGLASAAGALSHRRRYLSVVPTQLHRMLASPADAAALAGFDAVLVGGSAARPGLLDDARCHGVTVVTTYGMSETAGGCVYDGVPLDGVSVRIGEDRRVLLSGPVLFEGYDGLPLLTAEVLRDGWLRSPDIGRLDAVGRLHVMGRADDVAVSGGVNVPLGAVADRLLDHGSVESVAVLAAPDPEWGARVVAVVVASPGGGVPTLTELRDFVGALYPREWAPRELVVVDAMPMLASGKVDKRALTRDLIGQRRG